jgi:hypothetical protein
LKHGAEKYRKLIAVASQSKKWTYEELVELKTELEQTLKGL